MDDDRRGPDGGSEPAPGRDGGGNPPGADGAAPSADGFEDRWRRAVADLDNLRKRHARSLGQERTDERGRVAAAFLPVLDNLDLALQHTHADPDAVLEGVRAVREQAAAILAGLGYPRQDDTGVPFDPARHEVVGVVAPADGLAPGHVAEVVRPGYGTPERQLRPASVTVTGPAEG
ncbi:nucleotide exchange factor GrpE [Actinomycetospora corticicola]|uniref:Protein GrpE n=1 Tax=Actinomycetospora corticicola TaxID=663602 RepID=A0A7Y9J3E1_9PSEU|nr:molecular chaperone GrpE [Actinomycetospora corticicola]